MSVLSEQVTALLPEFVDGLDDAPAARVELSDGLVNALGQPPAEQPTGLPALLDTIRQAADQTAGPPFFGYIPGGDLFASALADLLAQTLNRYTGLSELAPGLVAIEDGVLRWLCHLFGLPLGAGGLLTSGGSMATLSMLVAARQDRLDDNATFGAAPGAICVSDQTHHCVRKARVCCAGQAAGDVLLRRCLLRRVLPTRQAGQDRLVGIDQVDSISLDPHKSLFLPYGTGVLLVRKVSALAAAHTDDLHDLALDEKLDLAHRKVAGGRCAQRARAAVVAEIASISSASCNRVAR